MYSVLDKLAHLPVHALLGEISNCVLDGNIAVVNSETGSGKSMLVPLGIHHDIGFDERIYVLQPSRILAISAAENLSSLSETPLGEHFGYLVGHNGGEENKCEDSAKVVFVTYGLALAANIVMTAEHIVLDEIHEQTTDISIVKALLKHRYKIDNPPKSLALMSATLDTVAETSYWEDIAPVDLWHSFQADTGNQYVCVRVHEPELSPAKAALSLVEEGYSGVLIFAPGVGEIETIRSELVGQLMLKSHNVEISVIHGQSEYRDRMAALSPPENGNVKILIGTNVLESGMNLPWVDAGVTTGDKKENHTRPFSEAVVLKKVPLSKANVDRQTGRTNRFCDSKFIICGKHSYDELVASQSPEIIRLPLTSLYMHCQTIDIDPEELEFMPQPSRESMHSAADKLKKLGFFDDYLKFTEDGHFVKDLPLGLESSAMLCHAYKLGVIEEVIPLVAVYEVGGMRKDFSIPHYLDFTSDLLDSVMAYARAHVIQTGDYMYQHKVMLMDVRNASMRRYVDATYIVKNLERIFKCSANIKHYFGYVNPEVQKVHFARVRQCILAGSLCNTGTLSPGRRGNYFTAALTGVGVSTGNSTVIRDVYSTTVASSKLRMITPKDTRQVPFTVAENITTYTKDDILSFMEIRPGVFEKETDEYGNQYYYVFGNRFYFVSYGEDLHKEIMPPPVSTKEITSRNTLVLNTKTLHRVTPIKKKPDTIDISGSIFGNIDVPENTGTLADAFALALKKAGVR